MIDHTGIHVKDPVKSRRFYEAALAPLGYKMTMEVPKEFTGGKSVMGFGVAPHADFWLTESEECGPKNHTAFRADTRSAVDQFYKAAMANGGRDNGAPGLRPHYHENYYGAFVIDPDGYNIEAVCHNKES